MDVECKGFDLVRFLLKNAQMEYKISNTIIVKNFYFLGNIFYNHSGSITYLCMDANLQGFSGNRNYTPRSLLCNPLDYEKNLKHNITHINVKHVTKHNVRFCLVIFESCTFLWTVHGH
jgi:hypothetical protein